MGKENALDALIHVILEIVKVIPELNVTIQCSEGIQNLVSN